MDFLTTILPHRDCLFRLALSITADTAEAEDVVQDTMLRAWERREEWSQIENIQAWLLQIGKNLALDRKKRMGRTTTIPISVKGEEIGEPALSTAPVSEGDYALIQKLITELPPPQDDIMRLRDIEGFSYREIAAQLSITEDQVRVYLHRARTRLRQQYMAIQGFGL